MTVTYTLDVSTSTFCNIHKLLLRWKGSIWKSIWKELLLWVVCYAVLSLVYRLWLDGPQRETFEDVCVFFYTYGDYIPLTFMLGFYVSAVFTRWKEIFDNLGWIDNTAHLITIYIRGTDETARQIRRTILRYMVLVQAIVYRDISANCKRRFPTMNHLVTAGLMSEAELREFDSIVSPNMKYWVVVNWIFVLIRKARDMGLIDSDIIYVDLLEKLKQFRVNVLTQTLYDWVPVPLVYTQVVNIAVRTYFLIALLGRQYLVTERDIPHSKTIDLYVPIMTILQFLFYIGWMKVAEVILNPLGDDDDDFEVNWIIDRNLQVGLQMVDEASGRHPELTRDVFWNDTHPEPLYTAESANRPNNPQIGSCSDLNGFDDSTTLILPRRRRFMSTTVIDPADLPNFHNHGTEEIPVKNVNAGRRSTSIDPTAWGNSHDRNPFLSSMQHRIDRLRRRGRAGSSDSFGAPQTGIRNFGFTDSTSDAQFPHDGLPPHSPFAQSMPADAFNAHSRRYSDIPKMSNSPTTESHHSNEDLDAAAPGAAMGMTTINEMLPIIEEEENSYKRRSATASVVSGDLNSKRPSTDSDSPPDDEDRSDERPPGTTTTPPPSQPPLPAIEEPRCSSFDDLSPTTPFARPLTSLEHLRSVSATNMGTQSDPVLLPSKMRNRTPSWDN